MSDLKPGDIISDDEQWFALPWDDAGSPAGFCIEVVQSESRIPTVVGSRDISPPSRAKQPYRLVSLPEFESLEGAPEGRYRDKENELWVVAGSHCRFLGAETAIDYVKNCICGGTCTVATWAPFGPLRWFAPLDGWPQPVANAPAVGDVFKGLQDAPDGEYQEVFSSLHWQNRQGMASYQVDGSVWSTWQGAPGRFDFIYLGPLPCPPGPGSDDQVVITPSEPDGVILPAPSGAIWMGQELIRTHLEIVNWYDYLLPPDLPKLDVPPAGDAPAWREWMQAFFGVPAERPVVEPEPPPGCMTERDYLGRWVKRVYPGAEPRLASDGFIAMDWGR